ncbi:hypothetical protein [Paracoccus sp. JM45]|uniref:hypothetical protein n=1 Tax=Paracoccus sp. JM45 TaxID=2283626 RepID=UPI0016049CE8|nr:hypothetical protein [Paracoccus sp. JM45]
MPLTHFLMLITVVILGAAMTLWVSLAAGWSPIAVPLLALSAAFLVHYNHRNGHDHDS